MSDKIVYIISIIAIIISILGIALIFSEAFAATVHKEELIFN